MEVQMFWYYLLVKLDDMLAGCLIASFLLMIFAIVMTVFSFEDPDKWYTEEYKREAAVKQSIGKRYAKKFWAIVAVLFTVAVFMPSTKQAAFIWIAPQIVENGAVKDTVKNIPELTKLGTEYLKELLKEKVNGY